MKQQKQDFRSLPQEVREERRRTALKLLDQGWTQVKVAKHTGVCRETIGIWNKQRGELVKRDFQEQLRGRDKDVQKILSKKQELSIQNTIKNKTPEKVGIHSHLWNRKAIAELIKQKTKKKVWLQTVSKYMKRWGFTPQRPAKYAIEQDPKKIAYWTTTEFPVIFKLAKKNKAVIHFGDEAAIALSTYFGRSYAPKGITPTIKLSTIRSHVSYISSVSLRGDMKFMMFEKGMNTGLFIEFLERLIKDSKEMIYFIVDNLRVHKSKRVQLWEKDHAKKIKLFFPTPIRTTA